MTERPPTFAASGTALNRSGLLDDAAVRRLHEYSIDTVEALVGAIDADEAAVAAAIARPVAELATLRQHAMAALPLERRIALERGPRQGPLGAREPGYE